MSDSPSVNRAACIGGALACLLAAGCGGLDRALPQEPPKAATQSATQAGPVAAAEPPAVAAPPTQPAAGEAPQTRAPPAASPPVESRRSAAPAPAPSPAPAPRAPAQPPATTAASPLPTPAPTPTPLVPKATAPAVAPKSSAPPLDLASLEARLRDTRAIGVFTKISLKNQVDDLLDKFRAFYKRQARTTLAELRQPYDMLLLKVLSLLQDSDPPLARDIIASREAIWSILADPRKFNEANLMAGETQ